MEDDEASDESSYSFTPWSPRGIAISHSEKAKHLPSLKTQFQQVTNPSALAGIEMFDGELRSYFMTPTSEPKVTNADEVQDVIRSLKVRITVKIGVLLYKQLIRPMMDYACLAWRSATRTHVRNLQVLQSKCLGLATGALGTYVTGKHTRICVFHCLLTTPEP
jgi:hypothetical protein